MTPNKFWKEILCLRWDDIAQIENGLIITKQFKYLQQTLVNVLFLLIIVLQKLSKLHHFNIWMFGCWIIHTLQNSKYFSVTTSLTDNKVTQQLLFELPCIIYLFKKLKFSVPQTKQFPLTTSCSTCKHQNCSYY